LSTHKFRYIMNPSEQFPNRSYSQEDVQQILNLALAQHPTTGTELSYAQLLEIADELRIPPEALKLAENKWLTHQGVSEKRQEFDEHRKSKLNNKVGRYVIINVCLVALNALMGGFGVPWSLYVMIFWGMGVGLDAWKFFYQRQGKAYDRAFQNWERKQKIHKSITGVIDKLV
jgi:2TM domain